MSFVELKNLVKSYGTSVRALDQVTFDVESGEWIAVMGPSGSGKTTLLNILGGLDHPSEGEVWIGGRDVTCLNTQEMNRYRAEKVGFVFQQFHLVSYLTVVENIMLAQYFHSVADEQEARDALKQVGLGERLDFYPAQLSGGEQQRICVARALINQPELILADEPTGNLDEVNEALILSLLTELQRKGNTIIMVTHDPEVGRLADRRIELHHGRLSESRSLPLVDEELFDNLLKRIWVLQEDSAEKNLKLRQLPELRENFTTLTLMVEGGWIINKEATLTLTKKGHQRASDIIRRHRLAERLFRDTFGLPEELLDANACKIEHTLSAEVTEKICTFLHHPLTCPHGATIPRGPCCAAGAG